MKIVYTILLFFSLYSYSQQYRLFPKGHRSIFIDTTLGAGFQENSRYLFDPVATFTSENANQDSLYTLAVTGYYDFIVPLYQYSMMSNGDQKLNTNYGTYTILKNASPGDSWPGLDSLNVIENITYVGRTLELVLGNMDSVKTYSLPQGRIIKISKNFGLVEIPTMHYINFGSNEVTQLKLFSSTTFQPQYNLRDYRNVFSFNKGYIYGGAEYVELSFKKHVLRFEILDKIVRLDSTIYEIAMWDEYNPFPPNCSNCGVYSIERDTFIAVVKQNSITGVPAYLSADHLTAVDYAQVEFVEQDTIFAVGIYQFFEGGSNVVLTSTTQGYQGRLEQEGSPQPLNIMNFDIYCYYPAVAPEPACQEIEDLTPTYERINSENQIAVFYNHDAREILVGSTKISGSKISLVDTQGRVVYSTYPQNSEAKIPCAVTNGLYQVLIETEKGNYRSAVAVW